jgi:hypothetical protein
MMKRASLSAGQKEFLDAARRSFLRVDKKLRAENAMLGLPLIQGEKGKIKLVSLRPSALKAKSVKKAVRK